MPAPREIAMGYGDRLYAVESLAPEFCLLYGLAAHELRKGAAVLVPGEGPTRAMRRFLEVLEASDLKDAIERLAGQRAIGRGAGVAK
ncbi:MAG: hypothetical protein IT577_24185 [Verrucomicrobiae bacterium]|nr:hypothetical protein [Verrucomicrobiae bacterium]